MNRVQLDELTLVNIRNIKKAVIAPAHKFNVISGQNGMGKTNLIEAVYMLGALRSFRSTTRNDIIFHGEKNAKISGVFGSLHAGLKCEIELSEKSKKVSVDGKKQGASSSHFQTLPMVLFHPQVMELIQGGPDARRRFIDRAMFQANSFYPSLYKTYYRIIQSRNKLLKNPPVDKRSLYPFDLQLADTGSRIVKMRAEFVDSMRPFFKEAAQSISSGNVADMCYEPKIEGTKEQFLEALNNRFHQDCQRKYTTGGPHSDDLSFYLEGKDAKKFASQGQQRTLVLSAKIAETKALTQSTHKIPLLLFDDVSSELDKTRNKHLFEFIQNMGGQVFITTTHPDFIHIEGDRADFTVEDGQFITQ